MTLFSVWVLMATAFSALTFLPYRNAVPAYGYTMAMRVFVLVISVAFVLSSLWLLLQWAVARHLLGRCCGHPTAPRRDLQRASQSLFGAWHLPRAPFSAIGAGVVAVASGCWSFRPEVQPVKSVTRWDMGV